MRRLVLVLLLALAACPAAGAAAPSWAKSQIATVVGAGLLAPTVAGFDPDGTLTQQALEQAVAGLEARRAPVPSYRYRVTDPGKPVTIAELDRVLVRALGLSAAAEHVRIALQRAGLRPPARAGTETIARLIGLRVNHPAGQDELELRPDQPATRAEAAYSLAAALSLGADRAAAVADLAASLELPTPTPWQQRILTTAVRYVGYPYVWSGTGTPLASNSLLQAPGAAKAPVPIVAGFDCSGFVWRVYKLTPYEGGAALGGTIEGRSTYEMSGEVPPAERIADPASLEPGDVLFFGNGPKSKPAQIEHAGIYLGGGWLIHSSDYGVTLVPFDGWYASSFAWARRPLREAGLE